MATRGRVLLIADQDFTFRGRAHVRGERFESSRIEAIVLKKRGLASDPGVYLTRHMTAESAERGCPDGPPGVLGPRADFASDDTGDTPSEETPQSRRRRSYRRRDLTADQA